MEVPNPKKKIIPTSFWRCATQRIVCPQIWVWPQVRFRGGRSPPPPHRTRTLPSGHSLFLPTSSPNPLALLRCLTPISVEQLLTTPPCSPPLPPSAPTALAQFTTTGQCTLPSWADQLLPLSRSQACVQNSALCKEGASEATAFLVSFWGLRSSVCVCVFFSIKWQSLYRLPCEPTFVNIPCF